MAISSYFCIMKKLLALVSLMIAVLTGCQKPIPPTRLSVGADSTELLTVPALPIYLDTMTTDIRTQSLQAELNYFLERHNVQDEGYEMVVAYTQQPDTFLSQLPKTDLQVLGVGHWRIPVPQYGTCLTKDSCSRIILGTREANLLLSGVRLDTLGLYAGDFSGGVASGHGYYLSDGDFFYEGQWLNDHRHGFGFSVAPFTHVRVGEWNRNMYLGERLQYTSERIYGIDISRYQHGHGRKKYPIRWDQLRISYLGARHQKNVSGIVDYPVSFVFIKSTESTRIRNPFYAADYQQARRRGIPVGAYHFFSTKTTGSAQAQFFLRNTYFRRGDLPPVLDIEPTPSQIAKMGGTAVLFRNIRSFLYTIERQVGTKPVLYVSQMFINRYLGQAPDLKHNYRIWIARYGEYKPDVKLFVWQLSPNGRVRGIQGEVDINVFNGYAKQFQEFLKQETIR